MKLVVLDFETFFSADYTLKKMTTEAYIRDPRFEALGVGIIADNRSEWVEQSRIKEALEDYHIRDNACLCHHAQFDGLILSHHYGIKPRFWYDTLSMARLVLGVHLSVGLDNLAKHFDLQGKQVPYNEFCGKRFADLDRGLLGRLGAGCLHDCALTLDIFQRLAQRFPVEEYQTIDTTIRMFTEPVLEADIQALGEIWIDEEKRRRAGLAEIGATAKEIGSNETFIALLAEEGVEVEFKPGKNGPIPAFAKTDPFMEELLENDNPRVQALAAARLGIKSTIDQTRAARFGEMATRGRMPVYLRYCGAHTTRWSGGDKANWQNLRRGGCLRKTIKAPPGCTLVVVDSSQIECRILNEFAGQEDVVEKFRTGADPYIGIASQAYGREITKADKAERGTGKQLELSCLGPSTPVLTDHGIKPITKVLLTDRVWDGIEWVGHLGVVERGNRTAIRVLGDLWVTPDHRVLCGNTWLEAASLQNESIASLALERGSENLLLLDTLLPGVEACERSSRGASECIHHGRKALPDVGPFLSTSWACQDGIIQTLSWTAKTMRRATSRETFSFLLTRKTARTEEPSSGCRQKMMTYDIACSGPRNRFAVLTSQGPIVVHNCGYGAGNATIQKTARLGTYGPPVQIDLETAERWKHLYRDTHPRVVQLWKDAELALARMLNFVSCDWGPLQVRCDEAIGSRRISLPGCAELIYDSLEWHVPTWEDPTWLGPGWRVKTRRGFPTKMYGAKLVENVVQYMARMHVAQAANRIVKYGIKIATTTHDELVGVVPLDIGQQTYEIMTTELCRSPEWMPDLPLAAEGGVSERYEK